MNYTTKTNRVRRGFDEYRVRLFADGAHVADADYFTDCRDDAESTARAMVERAEQNERDSLAPVSILPNVDRTIGTVRIRLTRLPSIGAPRYLVRILDGSRVWTNIETRDPNEARAMVAEGFEFAQEKGARR